MGATQGGCLCPVFLPHIAAFCLLRPPCALLLQVKSITNVFSAPGSPERPLGERDDLAPPAAPPAPVLASGPSAWLYFNLLVTQSQIFVPVYDVESAQDMSNLLWSRAEGAAAQKSGFEQVADMALAFAVLGEVDETRECAACGEG